jgi:lysophospholipase L1-like esterase
MGRPLSLAMKPRFRRDNLPVESMQHQDDDTFFEFAATLEQEFQAWRKSWLESLVDDYGDLARYRAANAALRQRGENENRVVFFGDSITEGWSLEAHFPGEPYVNRGISAQTTAQMLLRFRQDVVALRPAAVIIHAGTNDIGGNAGPALMEDIQANLASMTEIAQANSIRVILASLLPPPQKSTPIYRFNLLKHPPEKIAELNGWLKHYSHSHACGFLDYFAAMSDAEGFLKPEFSEDGIHPLPAGYAVMAQVARDRIGPMMEV